MSKPLELENRSFLFFVVASILAVSSVWAVYEEFWVRRPWKDYQQAFFDMESERARAELEAAKEHFESDEVQKELASLQKEQAELEAKLKAPETVGEVKGLQGQILDATIERDDIKMEIGFVKSRLDANFSRYQEAIHHDHGREAWKEKKIEAEAKAELAELEAQLAEAEKTLSELQTRETELVGASHDVMEKIKALAKPVEDAEKKLAKLEGRMPELTQIWLPDVNVVDRCHNCHMGISKVGYSDPLEVVAFAEEVSRRDGDMAEVTARFGVDEETIEKWVEMVDDGETPEDGVPEVFRTHPSRWELTLKNHPPERFACTTCHEGQGAQTKGIGALLGGHDFDHGRNDHYWIRPMLETGGDEFPAYVQASCTDCHGEDPNLPFADELNRGQALVQQVSCFGCHPMDGYSNDRKAGPTLTHIKAKTNPGWLVEWIKYPKAWRDSTSMPNFWPEAVDKTLPEHEREKWAEKRDHEVEAIAAYLWSNSADAEGYLTRAPKGDAKRGRAIVEQVGCYGCHAVESADPIVPSRGSTTRARAPKLAKIADKANRDWIYNWVKDPSALWHDTVMPSLRLSDREAADVATYLSSLGTGATYTAPASFGNPTELAEKAAEGEELIKYYGCFGCHDIPGFETAQRIGADLSDFGRKNVHLLDFGNVKIEGSAAAVDPHVQTWHNWAKIKMQTPRAYRTDRISTRMPQFDFTEEEVRAMLVFLKSRRDDPPYPPEYLATNDRTEAITAGEQLLIQYNCRGCHLLNGEGGDIRARYENKNAAPPELFAVGAKTRPDWLFHFLQDPSSATVRPWLEVRMPTFNWRGDDATVLTRYFNAMDNSEYPYMAPDEPLDPDMVAAGKQLFTELRCTQCHMTSGEVAENDDLTALSPNLANAHNKLRPSWIPDWLSDPGKIQKGARMPGFWPGGYSANQKLFGGDAEMQMKAVRDYVLSIGMKTPPETASAAEASADEPSEG